jgi:zinc transporter, ZIP family
MALPKMFKFSAIPCGAYTSGGQGVAGSNPVIPTRSNLPIYRIHQSGIAPTLVLISTAQVFWVALFTALATGLGALPVLFLRNTEPRWRGIAAATASGMMLSASVFALADEALSRGAALEVVAGMLAGALFFSWTANFIDEKGWTLQGLNQKNSRQTLLLLLTLFVHSIPEGAAIGVGYATGEIKFGWLLAVAIAVHNIPEGTAVSLPLRANGASVARCVGYSILTSMPQPIVAVPAFLLVSIFQPLLPASLGFAGGAMIFLVISELLPESFAYSSATEAAWGVTVGLVGMLGFIAAIGL